MIDDVIESPLPSQQPTTTERPGTKPPPLNQSDLDLVRGGDDADAGETDDAGDGLDWFGPPDADAADGDDGDASEERPVKPIGPSEFASEAQVAKWREEHGVPADPQDYNPPVVENVPWNTDNLKPLLEIAHEHNVPQSTVESVLSAYGEQIQQFMSQRKQADAEQRASTVESLRETWGENYSQNTDHAKATLQALSPSLRKTLSSARLNDGMGGLLIQDPGFVQLLATLGRRDGNHQFSDAVTGPRADDAKREAQLRKLLRTHADEYFRTGGSEELARIIQRRGGE